MIDKAYESWKKEIHKDLPEERVMLLKHMIASHHGKLEYGAITVPSIPEAMILHELDMIDSRIYQFEQVRKDLEACQTKFSDWIREYIVHYNIGQREAVYLRLSFYFVHKL